MAFDQNDTDQLYEKSIQPVLKANAITPIIINRREDNRDINHQIIEQLVTCDFCIADLTYTRPSVYFEAGYAQRLVDVIYTVRSDHLKRNQPDDRRVHFDLQMKPLIRWNNPDDPTFRKKLESRLRQTVLREWKRKQESQNTLQDQRSIFSHMPLTERLYKLRIETLKPLIQLGFTSWTPLVSPFFSLSKEVTHKQMLTLSKEAGWMLSTQLKGKCLDVVSLRIEESLPLRKLRDEVYKHLVHSIYPPHLDGRQLIDDRTYLNRTTEHHILASMSSIPKSRIVSAMPSLGWDTKANCFIAEQTWTYKGTRWSGPSGRMTSKEIKLAVQRSIRFYFIENIQSFPEFRTSLERILETMKTK
jgi:nucleoside 2-deoxyribosyltransferase